jgi:arginine/ornithine succinyltransferase subunit-like protein
MTAAGFSVRDASAADLPLLAEWLAATAPRPALPASAHEHLLLAHDAQGAPRATLRLVPALGLALPRASYHVGVAVHAARGLGLFHQQPTLLLGHDHTGQSELCDAAGDGSLDSAAEAAAWRALVHAALQRIGTARSAYGQRLIVELPGPRDGAGQSPFWDGLGRHFYSGDPAAALAEHGRDWVSHAAALMPRQPLMAGFLPDAAQAAIGRADAAAAVWQGVLQAVGLRWGRHVRIDDGGPILEAALDDLLRGPAVASSAA